MRRFQFLSDGTRRLADDGKCRRAVVVGKRHGKGGTSCVHSTQSRELRQNLLEKLSMLFRLRIFRLRQNESAHECVGKFEARLCRAQICKALDQQTGASKKQER